MSDTKLKVGEELIFLSESDVKSCIDMKKAVELCEEGERLTGLGEESDDKFYLPIKGDLVFKPFAGYLKSKNIVATKIFTVAKNNMNRGLPVSSSFGFIYDVETLVPIAILEASWLTGIKVGASSAIAAKYLSKKKTNNIGIIGAGLQGRTHLAGLNEIFKIKEVKIADINKEARNRYAREMSEKYKNNVKEVDSIKDAVEGSDLVITVTTADEPLIKKEWIEPGMTLIKIGSYQELEYDVVTHVDKLIVDKWKFISHRTKEIVKLLDEGIITHKNVYAELPEIVAGKKSGRENDDESILCIALGHGADYVTIFSHLYHKALELGIGKKLNLFK